jgi:hypothetical protein
MATQTLFILLLIGLAGGILSGMVGIGGGIIVVPALVYFLGFSQATAQGTSLGMMLPPIGILAAYNYYKAGSLDIKYALILGFAFIIGGFIGSKVSLGFISEANLKKLFGSFMLIAAIKMIFFSK